MAHTTGRPFAAGIPRRGDNSNEVVQAIQEVAPVVQKSFDPPRRASGNRLACPAINLPAMLPGADNDEIVNHTGLVDRHLFAETIHPNPSVFRSNIPGILPKSMLHVSKPDNDFLAIKKDDPLHADNLRQGTREFLASTTLPVRTNVRQCRLKHTRNQLHTLTPAASCLAALATKASRQR